MKGKLSESPTASSEVVTQKNMAGFPSWLENFNPKSSSNSQQKSTQKPNWFPSWSSSNSATSSTTFSPESDPKPLKSATNPFNYKLDQGQKNKFPVIEVNGPSIKLPSFPIMSDKLKLYSDIEKRTGSAAISADSSQNDPDFDLQFFPQR